MATRKFKFKHIAASASTHVGDAGELVLDTATNTLKVLDGSTPGGVTLNTDGAPATRDISVIRAQRTAGGSASQTNLWTITHISGNVRLALNYSGNLDFVFTLHGYTALPSAFMEMEVAYSPTGPSDELSNIIGSLGSLRNSPNVFSAFDPDVHKVSLSHNTTQAVDYYWLIKE